MKIRKSKKRIRIVSLFLAVQILIQSVFPVQVFALTSGPTQPEFSKFEPVNATEMVDIFTGDFKYNLPLLNIPGKKGGYPVNLFYNSVTNVEEEASMVGLGWNLGLGQINRTMRGLPDDFDGESIDREVYIKPQVDISATGGVDVEFYGLNKETNLKDDLLGGGSITRSITYSSYEGFGFGFGLGLSLPLGKYLKSNFSYDVSTMQGASYNLGISASAEYHKSQIALSGIGISGNGVDLNMNTNIALHTVPTNMNSWFNPVFSPNHDLEYEGNSTSFTFKAGGKLPVGIYPSGVVRGIYSIRRLKSNNFSLPAYGSINSEKGEKVNNALMDFTRVNDNALHKNTTHLAVPVNTDDIYSISSHAGQDAFTFQRGDVGFFKDVSSKSKLHAQEVSFNIGFGAAVKVGSSLRFSYEDSENVPDEVNVKGLGFTNTDKNSNYEKGAFRSENEMSGQIYSTQNIETQAEHVDARKISINTNYMNGIKPVDLELTSSKQVFFKDKINNKYKSANEGNELNKDLFKRNQRHSRAKNLIAYLKEDIYKSGGGGNPEVIIPYLKSKVFVHNDNGEDIHHSAEYPKIDYTPLTHKNQITAFEEVQSDGKRLVFGLPVKNLKTRNVIFAINETNGVGVDNCKKFIDIPISNGKIDHKHNNFGNSQILDVTEIPEYVHSYMLTNVLGEDYIDSDPNDGEPNDKDLGQWVKFAYIKSTSSTGDYKWRIPYTKANYNAGKLSLLSDGTGSYSYGEREQYYPYLVETDSHIAKFYYSKRTDNRGAKSELQNVANFDNALYSYKLDKIELYAKGYSGDNILEKTVHFNYKETGLCPGIHNSHEPLKGKLTLEKVFINNYNSTRGAQNPYVFSYHDHDNNYNYNAENFDRWGVLKVNQPNNCLNHFFPYTSQDEEKVNEEVKAYHLKSITLPSGSIINVEVSRDHYAYVQDKVATQMFNIIGIGGQNENRINPAENESFFIYFQGLPNTTINSYLDDLYEDSKGKQIIFKIKPSLLQGTGNTNTKEIIMGGAYLTDNTTDHIMIDQAAGIGRIKLKELDLKVNIKSGIKRHPFCIAAWQHLKTHARRLLMPTGQIESNSGSIKREIEKFMSYSPKLSIFKKYFTNCYDNGYGRQLDLSQSFVRLNNPIMKKYGGNVKVDKVFMTNIWDQEGLGEDAIQYGNTYTYEEEISGKMVSTGVASNEPEIGKEENAVYYIKNIENDVFLMAQNYHFEIHPVNDMFMPSPSVGYSKVIVRSLSSHNKLTMGSAYPYPESSTTGETIHEFYTAKDFPTIFENSMIKRDFYKPALKSYILFSRQRSTITATQGYVSETNDMHGKPSRITYFEQKNNGEIIDKKPVSSVEYKYRHKNETYHWGSKTKTRMRLDNDNVDLQLGLNGNLDKAKIYKGSLGKKIKMYNDVRKTSANAYTLGVNYDSDSEIYGIIPFLIFMVLPNTKIVEERLETVVTNKHINKKGILEEVIAYNGNSSVKTKNLTFDPYTGAPLTTSITNHFDEPVYSVNIPAYNGYNRMGPAMHNTGMRIHFDGKIFLDDCTGLAALDYGATWPDFADHLVPGDEFIIKQTRKGESNVIREGIAVFEKKSELCCDREEEHKTLLFFMNPTSMDLLDGAEYVSELFLYRSGNRNMLQSPGQQMSCLGYNQSNGSVSKVLNAQANTYSDFWRFHDQKDECINTTLDTCIYLNIDYIYKVRTNDTDGSNINNLCGRKFGNILGFNGSDSCNYEERTYFSFDYSTHNYRIGLGHQVVSATLEWGLPSDFFQKPPLEFQKITQTSCAVDLPIMWGNQPAFINPIQLNTPNHNLGNDFSGICFIGLRLSNPDLGCQENCINGNDTSQETQTRIKVCYNTNIIPIEECMAANQFENSRSQFQTGSKGIFLLDGQYSYADQRNDNTSIKEKGFFVNNFTFFNWGSAISYALNKVGNWLLGNKVTTRNKSMDVVETKDALGIYNSVHYVDVTKKEDDNGNISLANKTPNKVHATVKNAQYFESLVISFEKYEIESSDIGEHLSNFILGGQNNYPNITEERAAIISLDQEGYVTLDKPYSTKFFDLHQNAKIEVYSGDQQGKGYPSSFVAGIESVEQDEFGRLKLKLTGINDCDKLNSFSYHHAIIRNQRSESIMGQTNGYVNSEFGHSGKSSFLLQQNNQEFYLRNLKLIPGKKYYFTCWLGSKDSYFLDAAIEKNVSVSINTTNINVVPGRINGWQQVRGTFIAPQEDITLSFAKGDLYEMYIDDIRIHPFEALMESYVYDDITFQLKYILDDNNYYTKYVYDGEGKLIGIQKETERGVKTIQENRSYLAPTSGGLAQMQYPWLDSFLNQKSKK